MTDYTTVQPLAVLPHLRVTRGDLERLRTVVERNLDGPLGSSAELLELELERAQVLPSDDVPPNLVTMCSRLRYEVIETSKQRELTLVYPEETDAGEAKVSVLAPVGTALLGLSAGDAIRWPLPGGRVRTLRVLEVLSQPNAASALPR